MELRARTIVEGAFAGRHRSAFHGSSVEFAEHKEYSPGDEPRHIDWRAVGRTDRHLVKRFEDETELTAYLCLDRSGSMSYGGGAVTKLEYAATLLAALAWLLGRQRDRVGLMVSGGGGPDAWIPPRGRAGHVGELLGELEQAVAGGARGATTLAPALERVGELARRRSLVIVATDLLEAEPGPLACLRQLRARGHDVTLLHVLDRDELELPFEEMCEFRSLEDERRMLVDPRAIRATYLERLRQFLDAARRGCEEGDVEYRLVPTDAPLDIALADALGDRARRRRVGR
ncbi:MAG: DUF58 domain-containing protein [Myxococcales bacterium]|nr:DUF58 domain-containing protein [Myxococcales bacterium]